MPDSREKLYNAISSKYDLGSFEEFDTKMDNPESRKKLYESVSQDFDLGDFNTFEQKVGLKKNGFSEPTIPPLGQAFKLGGESTPQLPLTSQSRLGEKPIAKLTNIDPNKNYVKPQGKIKDFVEPISPITEDKATQETFLSNNKKRNEYLENFSNTILDVANKVPESFFYQKNKPTLWGTKEIEKGTVNVDGVIKAIDLEAEKIQREQGVALSPTDKQYLITNITNKLQTKKENQNAIAVTDAQLQKIFGYSMTDITGIKMPDGKVVKKGYFDEAKNKIEQTYEQEKNNFKQSAPIVQKTLNVEFAPELEKAKQDVKNEAELKSIPVNAEFDQLYKQEFDKYQSLVNSEQITVEQANVELEAKKNEIINFLTPKFEQINKEAEINYTNATKEIQSRYNKKYQAAMEVQKLAASQRIKKIQDEYSGKVPEEFLKTYAELLNKNIGYEFQKTANQNLQNFKNLAVTEKLSKAMMAGWSDVTSTIGGAMGYAGFDMSSIAEITAKAGVLNPMPEGGYENASIFEKIADTDWWIANGVRALPFSITTMPVGIFGGVAAGTLAKVFGAAKRTQVIASVLGGGAVGWETETFLEAGGAYQQAINEGKSEEEASEIASNTMKFNLSTLPLNVLQMMPIFGGGFKALKVLEKPFLQGGYGAIEEILQGWSQAKANKIQEGKDVDLFDYAMSPQAMEEGAIGFAMGQGMAVLSLNNTPDVDKQISTLMSSLSVGGEAQARKVLDIMKTNGAISEKEYNENINLLNYTLEGIKNVESFPIEDNLKASLVNKYVAIAKAKQLHTDDENDLASQASKEMVAEKEKEIKEILKGNEPVYLAFVKGSEVPIVTSKEEIDYILSNERGLEVFDLEVYNDESTNNKIQKAKEDLITTPQVTEGSVGVGGDVEAKRIETEAKIKRKDLFSDGGVFANELGGSGVNSVPTNHSERNGIEFVQFSNPNTGIVDVIMTGKSDNDFVGFYRIYENGKPTNKWSSKFENQSRNKEDFKTMISGVQEMLPQGHEYTEKTSISTDGLRIWNQQLNRGYELQYDNKGNLITNRVAINGDAINNELGISVNKGNFENVSVTNNADMKKVKEALLPYLQKFGLNESNIHFENGTVEIDLPVLKSNKVGSQENINAKVEEVSKKLDALTEKFVKNGKTQKEAENLALQSISEEERQILRDGYKQEKAVGENKAVEQSLQATPQEITTEPTSTEGVEAISVEEQQEIASNGDINKDEKTTNEVREVEDGQREKGNEGKQSKGKNDGQKTNDVQNEEVTEGGVKAPQVKTIKNQIADLRAAEQAEYDAMSNPKDKAKREEIYNRYDKLITPLLEQEQTQEKEQEATEKEITTVAEKASITPKNAKDLYKVNRKLFGLNKVQALASAIAMDRMVGAMAKRAGITKTEMYGRLKFEKATEQDLPQGVKFQVDAWHGSPYEFDKFQTEFMGKGEGAQAFGWGLYFTDLEIIARSYAEKLSKPNFNKFREKLLKDNPSRDVINDILDFSESYDYNYNKVLDALTKNENKAAVDYLKENKDLFNSVERNLYKVSLHKGKSPSEYTWLEWDKLVDKNKLINFINYISSIDDSFKKNYSSQYLKDINNGEYNDLTGKNFYEGLAKSVLQKIGNSSDKDISLALLKSGIDGVKYPAESISRGATSDTARGFNYVVFDENAVSIEEVIKFQRDANKARGAAMVSMDGQAVIYAITDPNVSTPLHELAHVFEHYLTDAEKLAVKNWAGTKQWDVQTSEKFARGFEKYLAEGKAPNSALEKVFANFKEWLTEIYNGIVGSDIDIELNDDMRELYSKMLGEDFSTQKQEATPQVKEANVKAIEEAITKKSGTIKNEIIKEASNPTEVKKILDNLDAIKSKLAGLTTKDGDSVFSEECKWG